VLRDAVIAGHDRDEVGALAWLDREAAGRLAGVGADAALDDPALRAHLGARLAAFNREPGSSTRVERLLLLEESPSMDAGEITDKGYVNQRAVLERRRADVERLFAHPRDPAVVTPA